jgi:hypothetical protein
MEGFSNMIWVTFWTLNPSLPPSKVAEVAAKLTEKGLYPPKGTKILGWYICPGGRGVTISESEVASGESAFENYVMWEKELPGIFASYETLPAVSAEKEISIVLK